jgi:flavin-dependent dehydrogenase
MPRGGAGLGHLLDGAPVFAGVRFHPAGRGAPLAGRFRDGVGRGVRRRAFDAALAEAAAAAGASLRFGTRARAIGPFTSSGRVVTTDGERLAATMVVLADGGRSSLGRALGLGPTTGEGRVGVVAHAAAGAALRFVEAHFADGWQVVLTPVVGGELSVAALLEPRRARELSMGAARWLSSSLRERGIDAGPIGEADAIPLVGGAQRLVDDGVLALGDAAGAVDPLVGCGISLALESAEAAAATILAALDGGGPRAAALSPYARARRRIERGPRQAARLALALARHPRLATAAGAALSRVPALLDQLLTLVGDAA